MQSFSNKNSLNSLISRNIIEWGLRILSKNLAEALVLYQGLKSLDDNWIKKINVVKDSFTVNGFMRWQSII